MKNNKQIRDPVNHVVGRVQDPRLPFDSNVSPTKTHILNTELKKGTRTRLLMEGNWCLELMRQKEVVGQ